jgi:hypothetical protein
MWLARGVARIPAGNDQFPSPSALHNRIAPADIGHIDQVTVTSRWHGIGDFLGPNERRY